MKVRKVEFNNKNQSSKELHEMFESIKILAANWGKVNVKITVEEVKPKT